jgi:hypothetical protein
MAAVVELAAEAAPPRVTPLIVPLLYAAAHVVVATVSAGWYLWLRFLQP